MPSYMMVYEVRENEIWVLSVVSTRRQWPPDGEI